MTAQRVTVHIKMEALSIDCLAGLLAKVVEQVDCEAETGSLQMADGDRIEWSTARQSVTF